MALLVNGLLKDADATLDFGERQAWLNEAHSNERVEAGCAGDEILTERGSKNVVVLAVLQCKDLTLLRQAKFPKLETW
jgi:hypothetical protein